MPTKARTSPRTTNTPIDVLMIKNTVEFAVRGGIPYAIDFMNAAPDADLYSVGQENFDWVLRAVSDMLIDRALNPKPLELTGNWPERMKGAAVKV